MERWNFFSESLPPVIVDRKAGSAIIAKCVNEKMMDFTYFISGLKMMSEVGTYRWFSSEKRLKMDEKKMKCETLK